MKIEKKKGNISVRMSGNFETKTICFVEKKTVNSGIEPNKFLNDVLNTICNELNNLNYVGKTIKIIFDDIDEYLQQIIEQFVALISIDGIKFFNWKIARDHIMVHVKSTLQKQEIHVLFEAEDIFDSIVEQIESSMLNIIAQEFQSTFLFENDISDEMSSAIQRTLNNPKNFDALVGFDCYIRCYNDCLIIYGKQKLN